MIPLPVSDTVPPATDFLYYRLSGIYRQGYDSLSGYDSQSSYIIYKLYSTVDILNFYKSAQNGQTFLKSVLY